MEDVKACTFGLSLGLGIGGGYVPKKEKQKVHKPVPCLDLTFDHYPKGEAIDLNHDDHKAKGFNLKRINGEEHQDPNSMITDNTNNKDGSRKKLRLTKEQSALLEDNFKLHNTLSPAQKQTLAGNLNLKHRQVEVWFQNRRARTKLKQREVDCEFLKKCCEKLTDENLRLKKELQELCALKVNLTKVATLTTCSSCKELLKPNEGNNSHKLKSDIELEGIRT